MFHLERKKNQIVVVGRTQEERLTVLIKKKKNF
jgi:hypothetical protein